MWPLYPIGWRGLYGHSDVDYAVIRWGRPRPTQHGDHYCPYSQQNTKQQVATVMVTIARGSFNRIYHVVSMSIPNGISISSTFFQG